MGSSSSNEKKKKKLLEERNKKDNEKMEKTYIKEVFIENSKDLTKEQLEKLTSQMTHSLCKIYNNDKGCGTGFFCSINYSKKEPPLKALITNNHVLDINDIHPDKTIKITINDCVISRTIEIGGKRKIYTNVDYDITIIEIKPTDLLEFIKYLEIDEKVFEENIERKNKSVYIIRYPGNKTNSSNSHGQMTISEDLIQIDHKCSTEPGSSGSPILDLSTFKVLGIHKGHNQSKTSNLGTFLKKPIEEFIKFNKEGILDNYDRLKKTVRVITKEEEKKKNEIKIKLKINKNDINQKIYFLNNPEDDKLINKELNETNIEVFLDNQKIKFQKYIISEFEKDYSITLKFNVQIKDCSYMFFNCSNITEIDLSLFNSKKVTNMNHMFGRCYNVKEIYLFNFNTDKVTDMSYLFSKCKNLIHVDLSSFETNKVTTMCCMFHENFNITQIYLPFFNTDNVKDMSCMFCRCYKLQKLNLQSFNTENVEDMSHMFDECIELSEIETSSEFFNTENANNLCHLFRRCNNLTKMEFNFKIKKAKYLSYMFSECENITNINLSNFQTKNVKDMTYMFSGCNKLSNIDLSNLAFNEETKVNNMFDDCINLQTIKVNKKYKEAYATQNDQYKDLILK